MKKFFILAIIVAVIAIVFIKVASYETLITVKSGNVDKKPLDIELNKTQDADCGMIIESMEYVSEAIAPDGRTWFFHDLGGMVNWLKDKPFKEVAVLWVYTNDTKRWIDAKIAHYSRDDITPMGYGFGAYENYKNGFIGFEEMSLNMLRGENMLNPQIKKQLLEK